MPNWLPAQPALALEGAGLVQPLAQSATIAKGRELVEKALQRENEPR
jgi:hypothetical protein